MLSALVIPVAGIVTNLSTSIALQSAVKLVTPAATGAITGFAIKIGAGVVGSLVGAKVAHVVMSNAQIVADAVKAQNTTDPETPEVL